MCGDGGGGPPRQVDASAAKVRVRSTQPQTPLTYSAQVYKKQESAPTSRRQTHPSQAPLHFVHIASE